MEVFGAGIWGILYSIWGVVALFIVLAVLVFLVFVLPFCWRKFVFGE